MYVILSYTSLFTTLDYVPIDLKFIEVLKFGKFERSKFFSHILSAQQTRIFRKLELILEFP